VLVALLLEEDELCPRALFRGRTTVIVSIIKNSNDENNATEEDTGILKVIYY
jgi:hypothetical protein